jgi:hypothetical protein
MTITAAPSEAGKYQIRKRTYGNGSVKFIVEMATSYNTENRMFMGFIQLSEKATLEDARLTRDKLIGMEVLYDEVIE